MNPGKQLKVEARSDPNTGKALQLPKKKTLQGASDKRYVEIFVAPVKFFWRGLSLSVEREEWAEPQYQEQPQKPVCQLAMYTSV